MIDEKGMVKMAERIFSGFDKSVWEDLIQTDHEHTPAQFQEICCQRALQLYWDKRERLEEIETTIYEVVVNGKCNCSND